MTYKISFISKKTNLPLPMFDFQFEVNTTYDYMVTLTEYIKIFDLKECILYSEIT